MTKKKAKRPPRKLTKRLAVGSHFICLVEDEIPKYLDEEVGRALWMYEDWPRREEWDISAENCEASSHLIIIRLESPAPLSELRLRLVAAKTSEDEQKRSCQLKRILEELGPDNRNGTSEVKELRRDTLFEFHGGIVEKHVRCGIASLESQCAPVWASLCSRIVDYRQKRARSLDQALDDVTDGEGSALSISQGLDHTLTEAAIKAQKIVQKLKWMCKHDSYTARAAARKCDAQFSESEDLNTESELQRQEKLPLLTHLIMNELYPEWKEDVLVIHQAFHEQHQTFYEIRRTIPVREFPAFASDVAKRVKDIDRSKIHENTTAHLSLALVGWGLGMSFFEICIHFKLHNLKHLRLDSTKFDDAERAYLAAMRISTTQADRAAAGRTLDQDVCISLKELRLTNSRDRLSPMTLPRNIDDSGAGSGGTNGSQNRSEELVPGYDPAAENPACTRETDAMVPNEGSLPLLSQSSIDSGYASNVGSQQVYGTTSVASSSGPFLFEGGGEWVRAAAGQKRPQVEDNATSKRHRPSAAEIMETTGVSTAPSQEHLLQELGISSEDWDAMCDNFPATSGMADFSWDDNFPATSGMADFSWDDNFPATSGMVYGDYTISNEVYNVNFSKNAATLTTSLSEPQPNGTVHPAEEPETQRSAIQDRN